MIAKKCLTVDTDEENVITIDVDGQMTEQDVLDRILSAINDKTDK